VHRPWFSVPTNFAFADEDIAIVDPDEDVGFTDAVEELAARVPFELGVETDQQDVSDLFFAELGCDRGVRSSALRWLDSTRRAAW
jgi:hypothetical protein